MLKYIIIIITIISEVIQDFFQRTFLMVTLYSGTGGGRGV